jgi:thiamine-phosphate pyrophosphorylase
MTPTEDRLRLMLITDLRASPRPLLDDVRRAVRGGVTAVMVRAPELDSPELLELARELADPVREGGALLLVNDRVDVAIDAGADGVHLKTTSVPTAVARRRLGDDAVIGRSTHLPEEIDAAFSDGADYVVFGPVFDTPSKRGLIEPCGPAAYHEQVRRSPGPVLALGGVNAGTLERLAGGPVPGIAVIRAILAADDAEAAARHLATRRRMIGRDAP